MTEVSYHEFDATTTRLYNRIDQLEAEIRALKDRLDYLEYTEVPNVKRTADEAERKTNRYGW